MQADNVFPPHLFEKVQLHARSLDYMGAVSPIDYVEYPDVSTAVPIWMKAWIKAAAAKCIGKSVPELEIHQCFFRLTTKNTPTAPHQAHNDESHSKYAAFFYVNEPPAHMLAGTALVRHRETGLERGVEHPEEVEIWERDTNDYNAWEIIDMVMMKANRLAVIESDRMHRAEPPEGFGEDASDGRLVLITFFS